MRLLAGTGAPRPVPADDLADLYAYPAPAPAGGYVRANMVATVDGAVAGADGVSGSIGSPADRAVFTVLRGLADVILVGAGTVAAERYSDPAPRERFAAARQALGQAPAPALAVVSASGRLPDRLLTGPGRLAPTGRWRLLVLTTAAADTTALRGRIGDDAVVVAGDRTVDPARAVAELVARGLPRVLCEGGPTLLAGVVAAGCLDELCLTTTPTLTGGPSGRVLAGAPAGAALQLEHLLEEDGTLLARWRVRRA